MPVQTRTVLRSDVHPIPLVHTVGPVAAMCEAHDFAFVRTRCHLEIRHTCLVELNNQEMVARDAKWGREALDAL